MRRIQRLLSQTRMRLVALRRPGPSQGRRCRDEPALVGNANTGARADAVLAAISEARHQRRDE